jgi:GNAT superfamily N-acetyltransferase
MSAEGMDSFLESRDMIPPKHLARNSMLTGEDSPNDEACILEALEVSNSKSEKVQLHLATEDDLAHVERLVDGLAVYDKEVDVIHVNREHYLMDGFNGEMPLYKCLLLQNKCDGYFCGMAFFYFGYDIEKGRFLYLEDLFIEEEHRRQGGGSLVMATLASIAKRAGCTGFVWQALDWSTAALDFYDSIGGKVMDGRLTTRFSGGALKQFISARPPHL